MCPNQTTLIRLLNGDLPDGQAREAGGHVRECASCGERYARLRGTWEALGRWEVAAPASGLTGRILRAAELDQGGAKAVPGAIRGSGAGTFWMRVAASVVVAVGAGVAAAVVLTRDDEADRRRNVGHEEVVQVLGLDALGGQGALTAVFEADSDTLEGDVVVEEEQS